jgi:ElaB/YqjD/DUF883 family membrane-anchored ribosome-binding protein
MIDGCEDRFKVVRRMYANALNADAGGNTLRLALRRGSRPIQEAAMMDQAVDEFHRAKRRIAGDFRTMIVDSEDLLKAAATVSDEGFTVARKKFEDKLKGAKAALADASQPVLEAASEAVDGANNYVRGNPWTAVGIAAAAGALIGFLATRR